MNNLTLIVALCTMLWYCVDRIKLMWAGLKYSRYITMGVAAIGAFAMVFSFNLDLIAALNIVPNTTLIGKILTGLLFMGGSSAISEAIEMYRAK